MEKYKELAPDRYPEEPSKVRARGGTPAGTHVPVLVDEVLRALEPRPGEVYLDATLGYGGHAEAIIPRLLPGGIAIACDLDLAVLEGTRTRLRALGLDIRAHHGNFAGLARVLAREGLSAADLVLADLGMSSLQVDDPGRGFTFKHEGPLDMRMDTTRGEPAWRWLERVAEDELAQVLADFGDEPRASEIASGIKAWLRDAAARGEVPPTTKGLASVVLRAQGPEARRPRTSPFDLHPAARTFQAVRMAVNREVENLSQFLRVLPYVLRPGGRAAVISFHGGEEALVRKAFEEGTASGLYTSSPGEPVRPTPGEVRDNPRARSARLHWARRNPEGEAI